MNKLPGAIINSLEKIQSELHGASKKAINIKEKTNAVLIAQEIERNQVAYELLENVNQILTVSNLYIDYYLTGNDIGKANIHTGKKYILLAIDEIKKLTQLITPPTSGEIGLTDSIENWIQHKRQTNVINFVTGWKHINERVIAEQLQLTIYRIIQEQLNNIIKCSNPQNIHVSLEQTVDALWLMIKEDGVGIDVAKLPNSIVLQNINTRSEIHNGRMMFESKNGKGSVLSIVFPDSE